MIRKAFIIDDDKMVLFIQEKMLNASQFCTSSVKFHNVKEALESFTNETSREDCLIFLDINMPYMSGWEVLSELDTIDPENSLKVVMVTSSIEEEDRIEAKKYHRVIDFLIKPVNVERLNRLKENPAIKHFF